MIIIINKCKKCGKEFDPVADAIRANAINKYHYKRTVCFECVPYKSRKDRRSKDEICRYCNKKYRPFTYFEGKKKFLRNRHACFECVPYTPGRSIIQTKNTLDGKRQCAACKEFFSFSNFSPVNEFGGLNCYCKICANKRKLKHCQKFKKECIAYKGGKCIKCGYNKCDAALEFHHRNPKEKEFAISKLYTAVLTDIIKFELDKCDLLCSNCHKEIHYSFYNE